METSNDQGSQAKKLLMWTLTAVLWLATVGLGVLAFMILQQGLQVRTGLVLIQNSDMPATARGGVWRVLRYVALVAGGLTWLAMVIGGMEYHFKHIGQRRSFRVFAWTIGIEIALIVVGILLQSL